MGLFNSQDNNRPAPRRTQTEQNQANDLRVKARNRLIGAIILVLAAIIIVPMVLDTGSEPTETPPAQKPPLVSGGGTDGTGNSLSVTTTPGVQSSGPSSTSQAASTDGSEVTTTPPATGSVASGTAQLPETTPATGAQTPPTSPTEPGAPDTADPNRSIASGTATAPGQPEATDDQAKRDAAAKAQEEARKAAERKRAAAANKPSEPKKPGVIKDNNRTDDGSRALAILEGRDPPAATAERSKPKVTSGDYSLQIASYGSAEDAQSRRSKLASEGVSNVYVQNSVVNGKPTYRLRVGPFKSREAAQAAQTRLRSLGYDNGFISSN